jgi:hypothetical protein
MKPIRASWTLLAATAALLPVPAARAEQGGQLASVTILRVADDVARNIGVDASQIPLNVTVPLDVAAAVCGIDVSVLARQADNGVAQCNAQRTASGLDDVVRQRVRGNAQR